MAWRSMIPGKHGWFVLLNATALYVMQQSGIESKVLLTKKISRTITRQTGRRKSDAQVDRLTGLMSTNMTSHHGDEPGMSNADPPGAEFPTRENFPKDPNKLNSTRVALVRTGGHLEVDF
jgi:hypothetical protein